MTLQSRALMFDSIWPGEELTVLNPGSPANGATIEPVDAEHPEGSLNRFLDDKPARPCLIAVTPNGQTSCHPIGEDLTLGRDPSVSIRLAEDDVSRRHARIRTWPDGRIELEDLRSANGTFVNGRQVEREVLHFGDRIGIGKRVTLLLAREPHRAEETTDIPKPEAMSFLVKSVAHDFNTLLASVLANANYLRGQALDAPLSSGDIQAALSDLEEAASRASEVTGHLLTFTRREGAEQLSNLSTVAEESLRTHRRTFEPLVALTADVEQNLFVSVARWHVSQVLANLLLRARDDLDRGGHISVRARVVTPAQIPPGRAQRLRPRPYVELTVTDDGMGLDDESRLLATSPASGRHAVRTRDLGLATVCTIVEDYSGLLFVETAPGRGTTFVIYLPSAGDPSGEAERPAPHASPVHRGGILLVENERLVRRATERSLRHLGYEVLVAHDASEAIEAYRLEQRSIQVVLLDMSAPGLGGVETLRALEALDPGVRVIMTTGFSDPEVERRVVALGAVSLLEKPYDLQRLDEALLRAAAR